MPAGAGVVPGDQDNESREGISSPVGLTFADLHSQICPREPAGPSTCPAQPSRAAALSAGGCLVVEGVWNAASCMDLAPKLETCVGSDAES
jgi:hypothetical protein